jgi:hypothetical protein
MLRAIARQIGRWIAGAPPGAVLGVAWAALIIYAFPGQLTQDSFDHLREARAGVYSDAHPPIINLTWRVLEAVIAGPFGMLVVQSGLLLAGLYATLRHTFEPRRAAWWTAGMFVFPPVMTVMAVIWKDCMMAGLLAVGLAGLLSGRRRARLGGLVAMAGAAAFRYNAFAATLPLVVLLFEWRPGMPWLRRYALSTAAWLATTLAAFGIDGALTDKPMHNWSSSLAIHDIAGTLALVDGDLPDAELRAELAGTGLLVDRDIHAAIRAIYSPSDFLPLLYDPARHLWDLPINGYVPAPEAQRDAIERAWSHALRAHPWPYVKHRLQTMAQVIDLGSTHSLGAPVKRAFRDPDYAAKQGLATGSSHLQAKLTHWMVWLSLHTPLFMPWIYAALSLVMLPLARRQRDVLAILLSGLIMESSLLPLAASRDYRYSHWMVITTIVGAIALAARRYRAARPPEIPAGDAAPGPAITAPRDAAGA